MLYNLIKCTQRIHRHTSQVAIARFYHVRIPSQQLRNWKWPQLTKSDGIKVFRYSALFSAYPITKQFLLKTARCERSSTVKLSHKNTRLSTLTCDSSKQRESKFNWSLLWELIQPDIILFILAACSAMAVALVNIRTPIVIGDLINVISDILKNNVELNVMEKLYAPAKKILLNCALQSVLTCTYITLLSSFGERLAARMRVRLFTAILQQDVAFFDAHKTGEIINRLSGDIQDFKSSFKQVVSQGLRSATQILGCGITLYTMSPKLTTVMALLLPGIILVGTGFGSLLRKLSRKAQDQLANAMSVANEAISNIRTVRAFAMEEKEISWYTREVKQSQALNEYLGAGIGVFQALTNLAINGIVLVVLYNGAVLVNSGEMKPGDLMSYLIATQTVQKSLGSISVLFGQLVRGTSAGARVFDYIETRPSMRLSGGKVIDNVRGDISLQNVRFVYPCRPDQVVFDNLSLEIKAGKMIALCGSSGSGKSTLASLIENFYEVEGGRITIDGVDLNEIDPSWLRGELIGYINQEPTLFATSVMENIRYGSPDASDEQVYAAARKANADEFIRSFPQGYNTIVGERGATVSGGQKQRIAIARALLKDPKILILDEATSALDAESERLVQAALDTLIKGRTVIVIAHRLSTVQNADVIAAMSHGQIKEIGTHAELLKKNGLYAELIRRQTNKDEPTPL